MDVEVHYPGKFSRECWKCIFDNLSMGSPHDRYLVIAIRDAYGAYLRSEGPIPILVDGWEVRMGVIAETCRSQGRCATSTKSELRLLSHDLARQPDIETCRGQ